MGVACVLKNSPDFNYLILGRIMGGVATSLLYSAFESWVASEFTKARLQEDLPHLFSVATFVSWDNILVWKSRCALLCGKMRSNFRTNTPKNAGPNPNPKAPEVPCRLYL